ncbi:MAG: hypothetical protein Q8S73_26505 [Deltaproteobacteria bacterium]|nr:hypothetical protein [Myxococcales bacterium]MDP3217687.1 hypothetical protein [Deltaproteobacteria bacterium]
MSTGTTTTSQFSVSPQVLIEAVKARLPGMRLVGSLGIVAINSSLPADKYVGETVTVPYMASLGRMAEYAENAEIDVDQISSTAETSTVVRAGKAFSLTNMARVLRGYANPLEEGQRMMIDSVGDYVERKSITALVALGTSQPALKRSVHSATSPVYYDVDAHLYARSIFGDETRGIVGTIAHSQTVNRMLSLKDGDGRRLLPVVSRNDETGLIVFESVGSVYSSDLMPVTYTVVSAGTTPPVLTITGSPRGMYDQIRVEITTLGARGTAQARFSTDGGNTWVLSAQVIPASDGIVDLSDTIGLVFTFAAGTYAVDNVYTSRAKFTTMTAKRGAAIFWHNNFGNVDELVDPRRSSKVTALELLSVCHAYKRLDMGTRAGVGLVEHN